MRQKTVGRDPRAAKATADRRIGNDEPSYQLLRTETAHSSGWSRCCQEDLTRKRKVPRIWGQNLAPNLAARCAASFALGNLVPWSRGFGVFNGVRRGRHQC